MNFSSPVGRARFRAAGFTDPGPSRPPYIDALTEMIECGEQIGRQSAGLEADFRPALLT
jgi:4-(2-carboxyphenyl)-2-oxobut-3-enoate aldolase